VPEAHRNALAHGVLEANVRALDEIRRRVPGEAPLILMNEARVTTTPTDKPAPAAPLLSEALPAYLDMAVKDNGRRGQSTAQNQAAFMMFQEVCGDLLVNH
jgi:hypothetical protein